MTSNPDRPTAAIFQFPDFRSNAAPPPDSPCRRATDVAEGTVIEHEADSQTSPFAFLAELEAIRERGAGRHNPDPERALSLEPLRAAKKRKGQRLSDAFAILRNSETTTTESTERKLARFGFTLGVALPGHHAVIDLDLSLHSEAHQYFVQAGMPHWRSFVADDALFVEVGVMPDDWRESPEPEQLRAAEFTWAYASFRCDWVGYWRDKS